MGPKRLFNVLKIKKNVCINFNAFYGVSVLHKECQRHGEQGETQTGLYGGICRRTDRRTVGAVLSKSRTYCGLLQRVREMELTADCPAGFVRRHSPPDSL